MLFKRDFFTFLQTSGLVIGIFVLFPGLIFAQQNIQLNNIEQVIEITQKAYGPDDLLKNGRIFIPGHPGAVGNPYFQDYNRTIGTIIIKGKVFDHTDFLYDVEIDRVIVQFKEKEKGSIAILLNQDFVDAFYIGEQHFINLNQLHLQNNETGYAELIYNSGLTFIIRHKKTFLNQYSQSNQFGKYSKPVSVKYIQSGGQLVKLPDRKSFLDYFEPFRNQIKNYFRINHIRYRSASTNQLYQLLKFCDELSED
jgi:hypothetical protein